MPSRLIQNGEKLIDWVVAVLFASLVALGALQVFFRYVVGSSLVWSEELAKILFFYIIYLGASISIRNKNFATVDYLYQYFPSSMKKVVDVSVWFMIIAFLVMIIYLGTQITLKTLTQITPALEIPQAVVYAAVPVGSLVMCLAAMSFFYRLLFEQGE